MSSPIETIDQHVAAFRQSLHEAVQATFGTATEKHLALIDRASQARREALEADNGIAEDQTEDPDTVLSYVLAGCEAAERELQAVELLFNAQRAPGSEISRRHGSEDLSGPIVATSATPAIHGGRIR